jgi:hypothetical protein
LYVKVFPLYWRAQVFETFAVVSTIGCIVIFVALYRADRAGRQRDVSQND